MSSGLICPGLSLWAKSATASDSIIKSVDNLLIAAAKIQPILSLAKRIGLKKLNLVSGQVSTHITCTYAYRTAHGPALVEMVEVLQMGRPFGSVTIKVADDALAFLQRVGVEVGIKAMVQVRVYADGKSGPEFMSGLLCADGRCRHDEQGCQQGMVKVMFHYVLKMFDESVTMIIIAKVEKSVHSPLLFPTFFGDKHFLKKKRLVA
jgi:hypothetical protein